MATTLSWATAVTFQAFCFVYVSSSHATQSHLPFAPFTNRLSCTLSLFHEHEKSLWPFTLHHCTSTAYRTCPVFPLSPSALRTIHLTTSISHFFIILYSLFTHHARKFDRAKSFILECTLRSRQSSRQLVSRNSRRILSTSRRETEEERAERAQKSSSTLHS